jgi:hypothetical protein
MFDRNCQAVLVYRQLEVGRKYGGIVNLIQALKNMAFIAGVIFGGLSLAYALPTWFGYPWYELVNRVFVLSAILFVGLYVYQSRNAMPPAGDDLATEVWSMVKGLFGKKDPPSP